MSHSRQPFVSVIVPVFNGGALLSACLRALECQSYPPDRFEVIVVDNGSSEDIAAVTRRFKKVRYAFEPSPGSYAARNSGIRISYGELIAFTDADCIPSADWIEKAARYFRRRSRCDVLVGEVRFRFKDPLVPGVAEIYDSLVSINQRRLFETFGYGATANLFASRDGLARTGLFDSNLKSYGDFEWCRRAANRGCKLIFGADVVVEHSARSSLVQLCRRAARVAGGKFDYHRTKGSVALSTYRSLYELRPPFSHLGALLSHPRLRDTKRRVGFLALGALTQMIAALETLRLSLGGSSAR